MRRLRDCGITLGQIPRGLRNDITDVGGVKVGQQTLKGGSMKTGVTAIIPHENDLFTNKIVAASHVFNGFGKTTGMIQINELGTLETPIVLTNTLSVGVAMDGLVRYMLDHHPEIGRTTGTVNPVVGECNDMQINDIRGGFVTKADVLEALHSAGTDVEQGGVGAGTGMICFGLKGGIGSASRQFSISGSTFTLGVLVLTNFGRMSDLMVDGQPVGAAIARDISSHQEPDKGSIMIILGTDLPVTSRQLQRIIKRTGVGLARTGSFIGNGSGDVVIGFSTANLTDDDASGLKNWMTIHDEHIDPAFRAAAEATEEAILNSLIAADPVKARDGRTIHSLFEYRHLF